MHRRTRGMLVAALALAAMPLAHAGAQLRSQRSINAEAAQKAIAAAAAEAQKQGWLVSISIVDPAGELIAFLRMDGAPFSSIDVSRGKARTAARFRRPTKVFDSTLTAGRLPILALGDVTAVEGGVPVTIDGEVVGAVGVSGVTSAQDAQVARAGAAVIRP